MQGFPAFANGICELWQLPQPSWDQPGVNEHWHTVKLATTINDLPYLMKHPREEYWDPGSGRVWIQTDNQEISNVFAGRSKLKETDLRPVCIRVGRRLHSLYTADRKPRTDIVDFIEWDPREYNTFADHAANMALDICEEWERLEEEATNDIEGSNVNYRLCFDGALRRNGQASAGLALFTYRQGRRVLLYRAGKPLGELSSSFAAELIALEWSLQMFSTYEHTDNCSNKKLRVC